MRARISSPLIPKLWAIHNRLSHSDTLTVVGLSLCPFIFWGRYYWGSEGESEGRGTVILLEALKELGRHPQVWLRRGRAMVQAVNCQLLNAEARFRALWDLWWAEWHWDRVFSEFFGFPCQYHSTVALQPRIIWGMNICPSTMTVWLNFVNFPCKWASLSTLCRKLNFLPLSISE
jgi:hypothetical protein